jgi:DNA excision repair protein ERCC-4
LSSKISFTAIIDTREQRPFDLQLRDGTTLPSKRGTLSTGDYSIDGLFDEKVVCIERKSLQDLAQCIGKERNRFERELERMAEFKIKSVIVEGGWGLIESKSYIGQVHPNAFIGSILGWMASGVPFIMADNRTRAGEFTARMLIHAWKRYGSDAKVSSEQAVDTSA